MCVCMCAVVWCVVYTHEQMLHSFNPARCHQLFSRQTSMVCSGAPAFKGLSCFLIAYDCRSFRWLTHTIQLHANSVTVPSTGYVMCRHKERNTKRKIWNRKEVIFSIILMLQWSDSSGILLWDQIVSVSFFYSGFSLVRLLHNTQSIPFHPLTFELRKTYSQSYTLVHRTWKGTKEKQHQQHQLTCTVVNAWCAQNLQPPPCSKFFFIIIVCPAFPSVFDSIFICVKILTCRLRLKVSVFACDLI